MTIEEIFVRIQIPDRDWKALKMFYHNTGNNLKQGLNKLNREIYHNQDLDRLEYRWKGSNKWTHWCTVEALLELQDVERFQGDGLWDKETGIDLYN